MTNESDLVALAARTVETRLRDLFVQHGPAATRLVYLMTGDRELADDVVQEAFARVAAGMRNVRDPVALPQYLRRAVVNLVKMHWRRAAVERRTEPLLARAHASHDDASSRPAVVAALMTLPIRQRAAIVLRYYVDLPESEIADALRCRPGTVKSLLSRALTALRVEISETNNE